MTASSPEFCASASCGSRPVSRVLCPLCKNLTSVLFRRRLAAHAGLGFPQCPASGATLATAFRLADYLAEVAR